jgi:capsular exopolysaccharide synthesis family protein
MIMDVQRGRMPELNGAQATPQPNLSLITSGVIPANPSELLASKKALTLLRSLEAGTDLVVLDTPPVEAVPDALSLAAEASGTIVVIEAGKTNATQAAATIGQLRKVGANVLGVVLNKARERRGPDYYYYYEYTAAAERASAGSQRQPAPPPPPRRARASR